MGRRWEQLTDKPVRKNLSLECAVSALEKIQAHNQQFKKKKRVRMPRETENRGINENFIDVKIYHIALFYSPLQNAGIQNVFLKKPS